MPARPFPMLFGPTLITAVIGGLAIVGAELLEGVVPITPASLGEAIVRRGNYPVELVEVFGWALHLGASFLYTTLFAVTAWTFFGTFERPTRWLAAGILALALGTMAALVAPIATETAISLLAGRGLPDRIPDLAAAPDWGLWNHLLFFGIAWCGTVAVLDGD